MGRSPPSTARRGPFYPGAKSAKAFEDSGWTCGSVFTPERSSSVPNDVGGIAVHIGARVAALARPGEVLVSRTVKDLVAGSGLAFVDRGSHSLKGVADEWQLYALAG